MFKIIDVHNWVINLFYAQIMNEFIMIFMLIHCPQFMQYGIFPNDSYSCST